jgi:Bacterial Ig-like domain
MNKVLAQTMSVLFVFFLAACGGTTPQATNDTSAPATPKDLAAAGYITNDNSGGYVSYIRINWTGNDEPDLKGYTLYYGTDQNNLSQQKFYSSASEEFLQSKSISTELRPQKVAQIESPTIQLKDLTINSTYYFAIDAEDTSGNRSAKTSLVSSKVLDPTFPIAISSVPVFAAKDVALELPQIKFTFNEPIKTATFTVNVNCSGPNPCTPVTTLLGTPTWNQNNTVVTYTPTRQLKPSTKYTLQISGTDLDGNRIDSQQSVLVFDTIKGPTVTKFTPKSVFAVANFPTDTKIVLTFSEGMKKATIEASFQVNIGTTIKPGTLTWNAGCVDNTSSNCTEMTFTPTTRYPYSSVVTWAIGSTPKSFQDDYALEAITSSFNTELQLQIQP